MNSTRYCINSVALSAYVDGELSDEETMVLERHIENCKPCQEMLRKLRCLRTNLQAMPIGAIGFDLTPVLQERRAARHKRSRMAPSWAVLPLSFAATITITVGILLGTFLSPTPAYSTTMPPAMALFDPIPPGGVCSGFESCYPNGRI